MWVNYSFIKERRDIHFISLICPTATLKVCTSHAPKPLVSFRSPNDLRNHLLFILLRKAWVAYFSWTENPQSNVRTRVVLSQCYHHIILLDSQSNVFELELVVFDTPKQEAVFLYGVCGLAISWRLPNALDVILDVMSPLTDTRPHNIEDANAAARWCLRRPLRCCSFFCIW
jgi:hypothetical protein